MLFQPIKLSTYFEHNAKFIKFRKYCNYIPLIFAVFSIIRNTFYIEFALTNVYNFQYEQSSKNKWSPQYGI